MGSLRHDVERDAGDHLGWYFFGAVWSLPQASQSGGAVLPVNLAVLVGVRYWLYCNPGIRVIANGIGCCRPTPGEGAWVDGGFCGGVGVPPPVGRQILVGVVGGRVVNRVRFHAERYAPGGGHYQPGSIRSPF